MQNRLSKLELTWIGKEDEPLAIEPRLLIDTPEYSFGAVETGTLPNGKPWPGNMLIHGDNLLALRALEQDFAGQIKCIYIDPPYNTGSAFEHYDDNREHSIWLSLMRERLAILHKLLSKDGSIWISLDDEEQAYCKVLCDEIFGRTNFVANVIWHKKHTRANDARWFSDNHDFILVYAKDKANWKINLLPRPKDSVKGYTNPDNDPRGVWASGPCHVKTPNPKDIYPITTPNGRVVMPPSGTSWRFSEIRMQELIKDNRIYFGANGGNIPRYKRFITDVQDGFVPLTIWMRDEVGDNQEAKTEAKSLVADDVFATPKPERLIERILTLGSNPGDIVLDSFLGSGTTAAVAHKMGRKWIGVELGNHAYTHSAMRMKKVIEGEQGGISKSHNWQGGGGFKFYELAPSLLNKDKYGNLESTRIIMLICLLLLWLSIRASLSRLMPNYIGSKAAARSMISFSLPPNSLPLKYSKQFTTNWAKMNHCLSVVPSFSRSAATSSRTSPSRKYPKFFSTPASSTTTIIRSTSCPFP